VRDKNLKTESKITNWHSLSADEVISLQKTSKGGLSAYEAKTRLKLQGKNVVKRIHHFQALKIFLRQFEDLLIILLIITTLVSWYLSDTNTTIVLAIIIVINILIGFFEEYRADRVMESLQELIKPEAKVIRDNEIMLVEAETLVCGDVVLLEAGDSVPADLRLFDIDGLMTNDYALTGESTPSSCTIQELAAPTNIADRNNMAYMGTTIAGGVGRGIVVGTGMNTELGTIASLSQESKTDRSPLQKEIAHLAKRITQGTIILITILVPIASGAKLGLKESFLFAIGIAAAMVPQGLPAEVNVALAQAAGKLAKARALVKRLTAVETLGATQIICSDKTGTLTKNEMTVTNIFTLAGVFRVEGVGFSPAGRIVKSSGEQLSESDLSRLYPLIQSGFFANNASVHEPDQNHSSWYAIGDPTEAALITLAKKTKIPSKAVRQKEFPFDSDRKRMSVVINSSGKKIVYAKGSPEAILSASTHVLHGDRVIALSVSHKNKIKKYVDTMSAQAMRNLAMAYKEVEEIPKTAKQAESKLVFVGITSMIDPPREEVADAMLSARRAQMIVTIITGDEARTAAAIAEQVGFANGRKPILTDHNQLAKLADDQIVSRVISGRAIFARVSPADKLRIVEILKRAGYILAVTGDGINDAPALKRADIGVAMGRIGSDVAKDSAEIVLLDDSFHTLVSAIQQGRVIFQNIRKSAMSALTSNGGELMVVLTSLAFASLFRIPMGISALQILAVDLMAELFPIAALGWDPPTGNIMNDKPRDIKQHILNGRAILDLILGGIIIGGLAYACFIVTFTLSGQVVSSANPVLTAKATTAAYLAIVLCQYVTVLSRRTAHGESMFTRYIFSNWRLWAAIGFSLFCVLLIIYVPFLANIIGNGPLSFVEWTPPIIAAIVYLVFREVAKTKWRVTAS